jgi:hypothetical protein
MSRFASNLPVTLLITLTATAGAIGAAADDWPQW